MRLLLFSADPRQVDGLAEALFSAGIQSEVRHAQVGEGQGTLIIGAQLWVRNDEDYHKAAIVCAGFTRRGRRAELWQRN